MSNEERQSRNEQREAARAKAREIRESHKRSAKRNRIIVITSVVTGVALVLGGIVTAIAINANKPVDTSFSVTNMDFDGGIRLGKDMKVINKADADPSIPNIIVYEDLQCPNCRDFEIPNNAQLRDLLNKGEFTLQIHPISFLDGPNQYSSRAGAATMCVAKYEPNRFFDYNAALFEHQPEEGSIGPSDDELAARASSIGITNASVVDCIKTHALRDTILRYTAAVFAPDARVAGTDLHVDSTPYIVLNGVHFTGDWTNAAAFAQWLSATAPKK